MAVKVTATIAAYWPERAVPAGPARKQRRPHAKNRPRLATRQAARPDPEGLLTIAEPRSL